MILNQFSILKDVITQTRYRVLWLNDTSIVWVNMESDAKTPHWMDRKEIEDKISSGDLEFTKGNHIRVDKISAKGKLIRNEKWKLIKNFVMQIPDCYDRFYRLEFLNKCKKQGYSYQYVTRILHKYWSNACIVEALTPNYYNCGTNRSMKEFKTLGRPRIYTLNNSRMNVDTKDLEHIKAIMKKYYNKNKKYSWTFCYHELLKTYYTNKETQKIFEKYPTKIQFVYHGKKIVNDRSRIGERMYDRNNRGLLGNSQNEVMGPMDKYQVDATVGDIYLVSELNRGNIIGRPTVYFMMDVFSRMITGFHVSLGPASWEGAMMTLYNTYRDKVELCKEYDVPIVKEQWPCYGLPKELLTDNGEFVGKKSLTLIEELGIDMENHSSYRPDLKGMIEQSFHQLNLNILSKVPGAVQKDFNIRGSEDYRKQAKLTLKGYAKIIIEFILKHNQILMKNFKQNNEDMQKAGVPNIPQDMWNWGIENISGLPVMIPDERFKIKILPSSAAFVTGNGIRFQGLYYTCKKMEEEGWFSKARTDGEISIEIRYDERNLDGIYYYDINTDDYILCNRTSADSNRYKSSSYYEIEYINNKQKDLAGSLVDRQTQINVDFVNNVEKVIEEENKKQREYLEKSQKVNVKDMKKNRKKDLLVENAKNTFIPKAEEVPVVEKKKSSNSSYASKIREMKKGKNE